MIDYNSFREFADSWGLLYLFIVFVAIVLYVFRPGAKKKYEEQGKIPLKEDNDYDRT